MRRIERVKVKEKNKRSREKAEEMNDERELIGENG